MLADFLGMVLLGLDALSITHDTLRVLDPELRGHVRDDSHWDIDRVGKKGSQESERPNLHREAETIVVSTALGNELAIFVVQVKIAGKLLRCWFANVAAVALLLFFG